MRRLIGMMWFFCLASIAQANELTWESLKFPWRYGLCFDASAGWSHVDWDEKKITEQLKMAEALLLGRNHVKRYRDLDVKKDFLQHSLREAERIITSYARLGQDQKVLNAARFFKLSCPFDFSPFCKDLVVIAADPKGFTHLVQQHLVYMKNEHFAELPKAQEEAKQRMDPRARHSPLTAPALFQVSVKCNNSQSVREVGGVGGAEAKPLTR